MLKGQTFFYNKGDDNNYFIMWKVRIIISYRRVMILSKASHLLCMMFDRSLLLFAFQRIKFGHNTSTSATLL